MKPLPALRWDANLAKAAKDHADDINRNNLRLGHKGSDGKLMDTRIRKYIQNPGATSENLA